MKKVLTPAAERKLSGSAAFGQPKPRFFRRMLEKAQKPLKYAFLTIAGSALLLNIAWAQQNGSVHTYQPVPVKTEISYPTSENKTFTVKTLTGNYNVSVNNNTISVDSVGPDGNTHIVSRYDISSKKTELGIDGNSMSIATCPAG